MFCLIWCQGTFSFLGRCIAPSSGAMEQGQQECKRPAKSVIPDKFCVVAVPGSYQFWSWALTSVNTVTVHLGGKESKESQGWSCSLSAAREHEDK